MVEGEPCYTYVVSKRSFVLTSDWPLLLEEGWVTIPQGFSCDLASVPRPLRWVRGFEPYELGCGSVLHDWSYRRGGQVAEGITLSRKRTDEAFLHLMKRDGVGWQATVAYYAVRWFGGLAWRRLPGRSTMPV